MSRVDPRSAAALVPDPEIPVVTIADLGILRDVAVDGDRVTVTITPTYSGCPAMDAIRTDIRERLQAGGWADVEVRTALAPAWSTDDISPDGAAKLLAYGIAPPHRVGAVDVTIGVRCPQCGSLATSETSRFGSTACKSLRRCDACREPFDAFKPL